MVTGTSRRVLIDGRPPWRAALLLFVRASFLQRTAFVLVVAAIFLAVGWRANAAGWLFFVVANQLVTVFRRKPAGIPVEPGRWPALESLVSDVAARSGTAPPSGTWLTTEPTITSLVVARRRYLLIGLPLLRCLTAREVAALVGRQLAIVDQPHPWFATRLYQQWEAAGGAGAGPDVRPRRFRSRALAALHPLGALIQARAERAAALAGGDDAASRAPGLARVAADAHASYVRDAEVFTWRAVRRAWAVEDVDDGWRRLLAYGVAGLNLRTGVEIGPLPTEAERRLILRSQGLAGRAAVRWYRFSEVPPERWLRRAEEEAKQLRLGAYARMRRRPVDDTEVARAMGERAAGILAEAALLPGGWRLEHPAIRAVLRGPRGQALDANKLAVRAASDPAARAELHVLLGGQQAATTAADTSARSVASDQGPTR